MPDIKRAEPSGGSALQGAMRAALRFKTPAREVVTARRNHYAGRNLKWRRQEFVVRIVIELEAVAGLHAYIHGREKIAPGLDVTAQVGDAVVFVFDEFLSYPAEETIFARPRLPRAE